MKRILFAALFFSALPCALVAQETETEYVSDDAGKTTGALWTEVGATKILPYNLSLGLDAGFRTDEWFDEASRFDIGVGLGWKPTKHWKFGLGYTFVAKHYPTATATKTETGTEWKYRNVATGENVDFAEFVGAPFYTDDEGTNYRYRGYNADVKDFTRITDSYWRAKHRLNLDVAYTHKFWKLLRVTLRERYQLSLLPQKDVDRSRHRVKTTSRFRDPFYDSEYNLAGYDETPDSWSDDEQPNPETTVTDSSFVKTKSSKALHVLRSRLTFELDKKGWRVTPFAYVETFNNLGDGWHFDKYRLAAGVEYSVTKQHRISLGYIFNHENDDDGDENIHAISVGYKLKF